MICPNCQEKELVTITTAPPLARLQCSACSTCLEEPSGKPGEVYDWELREWTEATELSE